MYKINGIQSILDFRIIRSDEVCEILQISKEDLYKMVLLGEFPLPCPNGFEDKVKRWGIKQVLDWKRTAHYDGNGVHHKHKRIR